MSINEQPIVEVILVAKNDTPEWVIEGFLQKNGFKNVRVRKSEIPYR